MITETNQKKKFSQWGGLRVRPRTFTHTHPRQKKKKSWSQKLWFTWGSLDISKAILKNVKIERKKHVGLPLSSNFAQSLREHHVPLFRIHFLLWVLSFFSPPLFSTFINPLSFFTNNNNHSELPRTCLVSPPL